MTLIYTIIYGSFPYFTFLMSNPLTIFLVKKYHTHTHKCKGFQYNNLEISFTLMLYTQIRNIWSRYKLTLKLRQKITEQKACFFFFFCQSLNTFLLTQIENCKDFRTFSFLT